MRASTRQVLQSLCIATAVAALTAAVIYMASYLIYPVTGIEVKGAHMFPETQARTAVPDYASLITLNSTMLERKIKSNLWVKSVNVRKDWDSGIVAVEVKERRAVLDAEIEGHREVFAADGTELPGLGGANLERVEMGEDQLEGILRAGKVLASNGIALESVDDVGAGGVRAKVGGRTVIFTGDVGDAQVEALPEVMSENRRASRFDLRSEGRVVVGTGRLEGSREPGSKAARTG